MKETDALCQLLDCGSSVSMRFREHEVNQPVLWISSSCIEVKFPFKDCVTVQDAQSSTSIEITCSGNTITQKAKAPPGAVIQEPSWMFAVD